jgi:hypothetical protein
MAFLGIASLICFIVSHIIVLFGFIEEMQAQGEPVEQALRNACVQRLRPRDDRCGRDHLRPLPVGNLAIHGGP